MSIIFLDLFINFRHVRRQWEGWLACSRLQEIYEQRTKGKKAQGLGRKVADTVQDTVFPFPATTSSPDPARLIFELSLAEDKGRGWQKRMNLVYWSAIQRLNKEGERRKSRDLIDFLFMERSHACLAWRFEWCYLVLCLITAYAVWNSWLIMPLIF